jgi:3-hydroxyacyl-CoA dehydrogenase
MRIKPIAFVGAGAMENGIAQVSTVAGFPVTLTDIAQPQLDPSRPQNRERPLHLRLSVSRSRCVCKPW